MLFTLGLFLIAGLISPFFGAVTLDFDEVLRPGTTSFSIFWFQRVPRVVLGLFAGGGLAVAGASFQAILRNPLATPYTLGLSGAAAFGASLSIWIPWLSFSLGPLKGPGFTAFVFALMETALIWAMAYRKGQGFRMETLLLAGITIGLVFSAGIIGIRYILAPNLLVETERWMLGGISVTGWEEPSAVLPFLVPCTVGLIYLSKAFNYFSFGERFATSLGVDPEKTKKSAFLFGALLTSSIVSVTGPIGFVGLIVPHGVRMLFGPDFRVVVPCSFFLGGALLAISDILARTIVAPTEIPVGLFTTLVGGPVFVFLLLKSRKSSL